MEGVARHASDDQRANTKINGDHSGHRKEQLIAKRPPLGGRCYGDWGTLCQITTPKIRGADRSCKVSYFEVCRHGCGRPHFRNGGSLTVVNCKSISGPQFKRKGYRVDSAGKEQN
jgi:hypothetical protein